MPKTGSNPRPACSDLTHEMTSTQAESCPTEESPLLDNAPHQSSKHHGLSKSVLPVALSLTFLVVITSLEATIVAASGTIVATNLKSAALGPYLGTAFLLTSTISSPIMARLSDVMGRAPVIIVSGCLFTFGVGLCAVARSMTQLLCARAIAGFGAGGMSILCSILLSENVPLRSRAFWHAVGKIISGAATALGGPLGGLLTERLSWRWAFGSQLPLCMMALVVATLNLPWKRRSARLAIADVDFVGGALLAATIGPVLFAASLMSFSAPLPTLIAQTASAVGVSSLACFAFCVWEGQAPAPIIKFSLFRERSLLLLCITNLASAIAFSTTLYTLPFYLIVVESRSPSEASLSFIPASLVASCMSLGVGYFVSRQGRIREFMLFAVGLVVVGAWMLCLTFASASASVSSHWHTFSIYLSMLACSSGFQIVSAVSMVAMLVNRDPSEVASTTSLLTLSKSLGSAIGSACSAILVQTYLGVQLRREELFRNSPEVIRVIQDSVDDIRTLPLELQRLALHYWANSFVYEAVTVATFVTAVCMIVVSFSEG